MRKRLVAVGAMALCLAVLSLMVAWRSQLPPPGVTPENFRRLRKGMTAAQVDAVLGKGESVQAAHYIVRFYYGDGCKVQILFSLFDEDVEKYGDGAVSGFLKMGEEVVPLRERPPTFLDWVGSWLDWLRARWRGPPP